MAWSRGLVLCLLALPALAAAPTPVEDLAVIDTPGDDGTSLILTWKAMPYDAKGVEYVIEGAEEIEGKPLEFAEIDRFPSNTHTLKDLKLPVWLEWSLRDGDGTRHVAEVTEVATGPIGELRLDKRRKPERDAQGKTMERSFVFRVTTLSVAEKAVSVTVRGTPRENWMAWKKLNNGVLVAVFCGIVLVSIRLARRNPHFFLRRIAGLDAVEEAIGRATEMGRPVYFVPGRLGMEDLSTIAATVILGQVSRRIAEYDTMLRVPHRDPVVLSFCQEVVKEAYQHAGRPDAFKEDFNFFLTGDQFSYAAAVNGLMVREKPATVMYMGNFMAESLLLAEVGNSAGAIQVAGTDEISQLPFFVAACDYTLIGEELYAASAYLSREPVQVGTLRGQDIGKFFILAAAVAVSVLALFEYEWAVQLVKGY